MAKKSDREAMAAALGGMVSRPAPAPAAEPAPAAAPSQKAPEAPQTPRKAKGKAKTTPARKTRQKTTQRATQKATGPEGEGGAFRKTGIGYVKADGTAMVRTVVMVTEDERQRLKMMALEAGLSPSDYVRRALGFIDQT